MIKLTKLQQWILLLLYAKDKEPIPSILHLQAMLNYLKLNLLKKVKEE